MGAGVVRKRPLEPPNPLVVSPSEIVRRSRSDSDPTPDRNGRSTTAINRRRPMDHKWPVTSYFARSVLVVPNLPDLDGCALRVPAIVGHRCVKHQLSLSGSGGRDAIVGLPLGVVGHDCVAALEPVGAISSVIVVHIAVGEVQICGGIFHQLA